MAERDLKVGFIGSGYIAREHAAALRNITGIRVAACADADISRAEELAGLTGCRPTTDIAEVIDASDAVWVCTPPKWHRAHVTACLEAGKHVYCEKPLATTLEDGRAIVARADASDALAAIGFNFRFHEPWQKCKSILESGELGEPVMFLCQRIGAGATGGWRRDPKELCGMTIESVSHNVDLLRFVLGEVSEVSARLAAADPSQPEFDNCLIADLRLRSGVIGGIQATWASGLPATRHGVIGTAGALLIEGPSQFEFTVLRLSKRDQEEEQVYRFALPANPLQGACQHFVASVRNGAALRIPIRDGLRALEVCTAMVRSAGLGGKVISLEADSTET